MQSLNEVNVFCFLAGCVIGFAMALFVMSIRLNKAISQAQDTPKATAKED